MNESKKNGRIDYGGFYIRRAFRILPPMLAYLATASALSAMQKLPEAISPKEVWASIFFYRNYISDGSWYTGHFWSLAIEEHFYFVVPLLLGLSRNYQRQIKVMAFLALACIVIRAIEFHFPQLTGANKIEFRTESRFDALVYGALWALILQKSGIACVRERLTPLKIAVVLTVALGITSWFGYLPLTRTVMGITLATLVVFTVTHSSHWSARILELSLLKKIGAMSYSLYIWQMMFFPPWHTPAFPEWLQTLPGALAATFAMGFLSHRLIETPLTAFARTALKNRA